MRFNLFFRGNFQLVNLPKSPLELQDILDRCRMPQDEVQFEISDRENFLLSGLTGRIFTADIYRLNLFAERCEKMSSAEKAVFSAVADRYHPENFEDMLAMTYGLHSVPVIAAECCEDVGNFCIENEMIPEIRDCPEELLPCLDRKKVGKLMMERNGGVLQNGCYCEPDSYQKPDITTELEKPEAIFRVRILAAEADGNPCGQWISLPAYYEDIAEISGCYGRDLSEMKCVEMESAVPNLTKDVLKDTERIHDLNALAGWLSDFDRTEFMKFKAVMQAENICSLDGAENLLERIEEYEFDPVPDMSAFGIKYLSMNLPEKFDMSAFTGAELTAFGEAVLFHKHGCMIAYGVVSDRGQQLYSAMTAEPEQAENETENCDMTMGGM